MLTVAVLLAPLAGCTIVKPELTEPGHFYVNRYADMVTTNRVAIFEFDNDTTDPKYSANLTSAVTEALRKRHIFSISTLYRADPAWRSLDLADTSSYSLQELAAIRKQLRADAVLFGSITQYRPFPHLLTALRLRMVDLRDGKLIWAIEQVWDSTDKRVEQRMKVFFDHEMRSGYRPIDWQLMLTSPRAFDKFVAFEIARTLPTVPASARGPLSSENTKNFRKISHFPKNKSQITKKTLKSAPSATKIVMTDDTDPTMSNIYPTES